LQPEDHSRAQAKQAEGEPGLKPDHQTQAQRSSDENQQRHPTHQPQETFDAKNNNPDTIPHAQTDGQLASSTKKHLYLSTEHYQTNSIQDEAPVSAEPEQSKYDASSGDGYRDSIEDSLCQTASVDGRNKLTNVLG